MLTSVALVLMMTVPGLGLFYGGMVRKKNVGDTVMTSFAITCLVTVLYVVVTYSMAFPAGTPFSAASSETSEGHAQRQRQGRYRQSELARPDHPGSRYICFTDDVCHYYAGAHCRRICRADEVLGNALVHRPVGDVGLFADRALGLGPGWVLLDSATRGWINVLDFAGGTVVHINAGVAG